MKKLLLVIFAYASLLPMVGYSQSHIIKLDSASNQITVINYYCDILLIDNGISNSNYSNNSDYWTAFCPPYSINRTKISFNEFDIHPSDRVEIYYGVGINGNAYIENPQQPYFTNQELLEKEILASLSDTSGCLTVRIVSDSTLNATGFKANISCVERCQIPVVDLDTFFIKYNSTGQATNVAVKDIIDTIYNISDNTYTANHFKALDFCEGDSVVIFAKPLFPENNSPFTQSISTCIFNWNFGDSVTQTVNGSNMVSHKFNNNISFVQLKITDINQMCKSTNNLDLRARKSTNPIRSLLDTINICSGTTFNYNVGYENGNDLRLYSSYNNRTFRYDSISFIPDGLNCSMPCLEAKITVDAFPSGSKITNVNDILSVCINIEHSFIGDLSMELVCPNGTSTVLKHFTNSGGAYLGSPIDDINSTSPCNPLANPAGVGWNYCFSNQLLDGAKGVISGTSMGSPIDSTHISTGAGYFQTPTQSVAILPGGWGIVDLNGFSNLIGCPLNGDWKIRICDYRSIDNGYLFSWNLELSQSGSIDNQSSPIVNNVLMNGAYVIGIQDSIFTISTPVQIDTNVSNIYKINLFDNFGCTWDTSFYLNILQTPIVNLGQDTSIFEPITLYSPTSTVDNYTYFWHPALDTTTYSSFTTPDILTCDSTINYSVDVYNNNPHIYCHGYDDINITFNPTPTIPINIDAQINIPENNIILTWESQAMKYYIYRNEIYIATTTFPIYVDPNLVQGEDYCYRIKAINNSCESEFSETLCKNFIGLNSISKNEPLITLYPNPAKSTTTLKVEGLEDMANVSLYDLRGRMIKQLKLYSDQKELKIDLNNLSDGVYNIRIENNDFKKIKKLVIAK
ncbi:MAG: iron-regulated protein FrpC [Bacteroidetes bacterium]|nr:iron-regulated protein FrpC [Bacteroidota bacterium]